MNTNNEKVSTLDPLNQIPDYNVHNSIALPQTHIFPM